MRESSGERDVDVAGDILVEFTGDKDIGDVDTDVDGVCVNGDVVADIGYGVAFGNGGRGRILNRCESEVVKGD